MLSNNRKFHFEVELNIKKSRVLNKHVEPKDDTVNWLFLKVAEKQFSFIYEWNPLQAHYNFPFDADISFTAFESVKGLVSLNYMYEILRGQEQIGTLKLIRFID